MLTGLSSGPGMSMRLDPCRRQIEIRGVHEFAGGGLAGTGIRDAVAGQRHVRGQDFAGVHIHDTRSAD